MSIWLLALTLASAASAAPAPPPQGLTAGGWAVMLVSVGGVTLFLAWCLWRVLTLPGAESHLHSSSDQTPDAEERV